MDGPDIVAIVTVGIILVTTVISGPLVGAVHLTDKPDDQDISSNHHATVQVLKEPVGPVVLERGRFGNDVYILRVPPLDILARNITGAPTVTYKVIIHGLGYTRVTSYILESGDVENRRTLEVTTKSFPPDEITQTEYSAELLVTVHDDKGSTVVYQTNTSVVVQG